MSILNAADVRSVTWRKLSAHIESRLSELRVQLEADYHDHAATQALRARIAELKQMLSLADLASDSSEPTPAFKDVVLGIDQA